ncbi:GMC family oxidoreductase [Salicibibacter cibarius]|uniref:GMC family oxidoreductase n=1 Tax=Salicibibacter cibarius TaxID=2743000 RepID=A0A7T6Z5M4_9BACI|nr:GMC family oxidoreductase [Salicibibacter cibarius]QQK76826.1 GMC family oxidoreductase [Salicibibacter cibarius]
MPTQLDKVDVVTVGVGWTGGIIAAELSKAGYQVVGLERGGEVTVDDYLHSKDQLKYDSRIGLMHSLSNDTVTYRNNQDMEALPIRENSNLRNGTHTGGGGKHWAGQTWRYLPYDFEIYSQTVDRYGEEKIPEGMTIQDWGITYDELEPYYDRFEQTAGISGEEGSFGPERSNPYPTPPLKESYPMRMFREAADNLGYHPYRLPSANISETYENPDGQTIYACQYCSFCANYGCDFAAKSDPVITVIPTAQETGNFELRTGSNVTRILYEGDQATGVLFTDLETGEEFEQPADIVVLTSYTFNNVRLLLLSEIGDPYDPETGEGVIGKNFTDHHGPDSSCAAIGFFEDQKFNLHMGAGALGIVYDDFVGDNFDHTDEDFIHGGMVRYQQGGANPMTNNEVPNGTPNWGREFKEKSLYYANRSLVVNFMFNSMPYQDHYLDLDPTYTDSDGDPLIRMTYDFSDHDRSLFNFGIDLCVEMLEEMGADIIEPNEEMDRFEVESTGFTFQHSSGGAIMGDSPDTSAVNNYLQMWDMDNLFVVGASAFPHFGAPNPTATAGALAYRAAEGIEEYLENGGGLLVKERERTKHT